MKPGKDDAHDKHFQMEHRPRLHFKNQSFARWFRIAPFKNKDNIVSNEWIDKLDNHPLFRPKYAKQEENMVYLISGEYGRLWLKEREVWYSKINQKSEYELDMERRRKKLRKEALEGKKQAEISIQQRKERKAKEAEAKAKAEAEAKAKAERLKARMEACVAKRKPKKKKKAEPQEKEKKDDCPPGWKKVELTLQCECSAHKDEKSDEKSEKEVEVQSKNGKEECDCPAL